MFNKFVATVITATLSFSATSAFAVNDRVLLIRNCVGYDDNENPVGYLKVNDYYRIVNFGEFSTGQNKVKIWTYNKRNESWRKVNIANSCLKSNQGKVIRF